MRVLAGSQAPAGSQVLTLMYFGMTGSCEFAGSCCDVGTGSQVPAKSQVPAYCPQDTEGFLFVDVQIVRDSLTA